MARENQGLQIALIIFVMLTIVLGVTTYLFYRKFDDASKAQASADSKLAEANNRAGDNEKQANALKKLIGYTATDNLPAIEEEVKKQMDQFGANYPEEDRVYKKMLAKMQSTIDKKNDELTDEKAKIPVKEDEYKANLEAKEAQVQQFQADRDKAGNDLTAAQAAFQNARDQITGDQARLQEDLQRERKKATDRLASIEARVQEAEKKRKDLEEVNQAQSTKIAKIEGGRMVGEANGEITWVNQRNSTVWINLGRADGLMRQVTFSVYPVDVTDMTAKDADKGSIEITQILGDHLAQARVLRDDISRPILPHDKIYTPLWSPGEKRHFAVAGAIDLDGDGRSDLEMLKNLIATNGGVVDCYVNSAGDQIGKITVNTNALILGKQLTDKDDARQRAAYTKVLSEADRLRLPVVQLGDLLQRMGWRNMSPVIKFGAGANLKDFRPKPEHEVPKKSTGSVSDLFEKRQPPKAPASAY